MLCEKASAKSKKHILDNIFYKSIFLSFYAVNAQ